MTQMHFIQNLHWEVRRALSYELIFVFYITFLSSTDDKCKGAVLQLRSNSTYKRSSNILSHRPSRYPSRSPYSSVHHADIALHGISSCGDLTLSAANYAEAVDILKKRFGDQQLIISRHMETLLNTDIVTSDHNVRGLRRLYDNVESHMRSLKALGVNPDAYGTMLSSVLLNKLPPELRLIVSRRASGSSLSIDTLMKTVHEELAARERTTTATPLNDPRRGQDKSRSTATTLFSGTHSCCCYCQGTHPSLDCPKVTEASPQRQILRSSG